jgi:hypothetical protein
MRDMLGVLDVRLAAAHIRGLRGGIFYSYLVFADGREVTARPSDSVALALRTGASIFVREEILNEAGVVIPEEEAGVVIPEEEAGVVIPPGFSTRVDNSPSGSGSGLSEPEDPQAEVELTRQLTDMVAELMRELDETRADNVRLRHQIETHRCGVYTGAREIDHAEVALTRT